MSDANLNRLMPRKGRSPGNAARESFFGRMKTDLLYPRDRRSATVERFIEAVDSYIRWYNEKRIKISLCAPSLIEYPEGLGLTA
jgi:transposase InsO family protein